MTRDQYAATGDALVARIVALIPTHPEILAMAEPWPLFKVEGFECQDLEPSYAQASAALAKAQAMFKAEAAS